MQSVHNVEMERRDEPGPGEATEGRGPYTENFLYLEILGNSMKFRVRLIASGNDPIKCNDSSIIMSYDKFKAE